MRQAPLLRKHSPSSYRVSRTVCHEPNLSHRACPQEVAASAKGVIVDPLQDHPPALFFPCQLPGCWYPMTIFVPDAFKHLQEARRAGKETLCSVQIMQDEVQRVLQLS